MREHQEAPKPKCERIPNKKVQASKALETSNFRKRLEILCCICMSVLDVCLYDWINMEKEKKTTVIFSQIWKQLEETKSFWYFLPLLFCICGTLSFPIYIKCKEISKPNSGKLYVIFHFHFHHQMCIKKMMPKKDFLIFVLVSILKV